jgi:N-acetylglucosaminyl-diphospho-decaprenol L-rhamnosyltransferase
MISIIIVNWNTGALLATCLKSLAALPAAEQGLIQKIVVVDNNSSDTSLPQAEEATTALPIDFIKLEKNIGFARANNVAFEHLQQGLQTPVLLLNPDTEVLPGALAAMITALESNQKIGIVGPQLLNPDRTIQPSVRKFPTVSVLAFLVFKLHYVLGKTALWKDYIQTSFDYSKEQPVDQVMGAALLLRAKLATGLDGNLQWWFDDVDVCKRAHEAGWEVLYTPQAQVIHHGGTSFHKLDSITKWWRFTASAARYAHKHLL